MKMTNGLCLSLALLCAVLSAVECSPPQKPTNHPNDYRLRRRDPSGCDPNSCNYFMGVDTNSGNSSYLDFYLVGQAAGWVAVGFSETANMYDADVIGCSVDADNAMWVVAVDSYNPAERANLLDDSEIDGDPEDLVPYSLAYEDGNITCIFSRLIEGVDPYPQDRNLNETYFFLFGLGNTGRAIANVTAFSAHEEDPSISKRRYNPVAASGEITISTLKDSLITAHSVLMLIAWPVLSFTAIFFAAWMKPALPNGEWFQVHRALNLASLLVAVVGVVLVFIAHKNQDPPGLIDLGKINQTGTAHFALGILITAMQIANPLIAICRCKPDGKRRWIFNLIHGIAIGLVVEMLAYINVGMGVSIYSTEQSDYGDLTLLWVYLAFAVLTVLLSAILFIAFTGEAWVLRVDAQSIAPSPVRLLLQMFNKYTLITTDRLELVDTTSFHSSRSQQALSTSKPTNTSNPPSPSPRKPPSRDAPLRWLALAVFLGITIPFILSLIVLVIVRRQ